MNNPGRVNSNQKITTVLFDLDDTLINTFKAREDTIKDVLIAGGITPDNGWNLANFRGLELRDIFRRSGVKEDKLDEHHLSYRRIYWTKTHAPVELYDGIHPTLLNLHGRGINMGVVTQKGREFLLDGCRAGAIVELEKTKISHFFGIIIGFEDVRQTKPDPEGINLALVKLQSRPEETLFVGDSWADILAAKTAGCLCCHAQWGITNSEDLGADFVAASPQQLLNFIFPG